MSRASADQAELRLSSHNAQRTTALGAVLGGYLKAGDVICLSGELGAGKTVFSRGLGTGWGASQPLTSPTYNLVHEHRRARDRQRLYHIDLYRIQAAAEAETLGLDDILDGAGSVIFEWPERILNQLPPERLWIDIELTDSEDARELHFEARGARYVALLAALRMTQPA